MYNLKVIAICNGSGVGQGHLLSLCILLDKKDWKGQGDCLTITDTTEGFDLSSGSPVAPFTNMV